MSLCPWILDLPPESENAVHDWRISLREAPSTDPVGCLYGCFCPWCATYQLRKRALGGDMGEYKLFQGDMSLCCLKPGRAGEQMCPRTCLCLEVLCCLGCAVSATRKYIMAKYKLRPDPCDQCIVKCNNVVQIINCLLGLVSICIPDLGDAACVTDLIAKTVFLSTVGCMTTQQKHEIDYWIAKEFIPESQEMTRKPSQTTREVKVVPV